METHQIHPELLKHKVRVLVVECGGNGSAIADGLPYLHQALRAYGHPEGIHVTLLDPDVISATNCVRQPFSQSEIGLYKSVVLANRLNLFCGLDWQDRRQNLSVGTEALFWMSKRKIHVHTPGSPYLRELTAECPPPRQAVVGEAAAIFAVIPLAKKDGAAIAFVSIHGFNHISLRNQPPRCLRGARPRSYRSPSRLARISEKVSAAQTTPGSRRGS
jgi:hypothetical protein